MIGVLDTEQQTHFCSRLGPKRAIYSHKIRLWVVKDVTSTALMLMKQDAKFRDPSFSMICYDRPEAKLHNLTSVTLKIRSMSPIYVLCA